MKRRPAAMPPDGIQELRQGIMHLQENLGALPALQRSIEAGFDGHEAVTLAHQRAIEESNTLQADLTHAVLAAVEAVQRLTAAVEKQTVNVGVKK